MKQLLVLTIVFLGVGCAQPQHVSTAWTMTFNCDGNVKCADSMGAWSGSGSFASESDCLAYETGFLNSFGNPQVSCTSCTGN
jgi:hypothetical protein